VKVQQPNIIVLFVPPNTTSETHPQDVSVPKPCKTAVMQAFQNWQQERYAKGIREGVRFSALLIQVACAMACVL
jgi:hypothetical protein